jgi:hypothetical protein
VILHYVYDWINVHDSVTNSLKRGSLQRLGKEVSKHFRRTIFDGDLLISYLLMNKEEPDIDMAGTFTAGSTTVVLQ